MAAMTQPPTAPVWNSAEFGMDTQRAAREAARYWWIGLVTSVAWFIAALVVLQFDDASIKTVGLIIGCMFLAAGTQQLVRAAIDKHLRWLWVLSGLLFVICGIVSLANPEDTFAGVADTLGFLFLAVGVWWIVESLAGPTRWLHLSAGIIMLVMAFWTSGQFFIEKAYVLLVFAGVWALLHGVTDMVAAFAVRSALDDPDARD
jgi:uncharacterized membrane protein HdeD (DUF308 family)